MKPKGGAARPLHSYEEICREDPTCHRVIRDGGDAEACVVALYNFKEKLLEDLVKFELKAFAESPERVILVGDNRIDQPKES